MKRTVAMWCVLAVGCGQLDSDSDPALGDDRAELNLATRRVQAGIGLQLLEVTDDDHAIYQAGQQVFAADLRHHGAPALIADVPGTNTAFVYRVGKVAFVWTNPDRTLPGFGVSPLVIWSEATGANLASTASAIGTLATSATPDGDQVLFPSASTANGATGDLILASTDLSEQTTIAAGIPLGFPTGPCVPRLSFFGHRDDLVGALCAAGTTTPMLARWRHGVRVDLAGPLFAPPRLALDPDREQIATLLAGSQHPIVVDRRGEGTVVAEVTAANVFFGGDGAVIYLTRPVPGGPLAVSRVRGDQPARHVADALGLYRFAFGSVGLASPITSADGKKLLYFDAFDPNVGLATNVVLKDVRTDAPPVTLDVSAASGIFGAPFTEDSDYALYTQIETVNFAVGPMFAAGPRGDRQYSDELGWQWIPAYRSTITYNDNAVLDFTNFALSTADLKAVDLSRRHLAPQLIAEQANVTYFPSHRGHGVVYTLDHGGAPGLYLGRVSPH